VDRFGPESVDNLLSSIWDEKEERPFPPELQKYILEPVIGNLQIELKDVCSSNCRRIVTEPEILQKPEIRSYWERLRLDEKKSVDERKILTMESLKELCQVGFPVDKDFGCPLCNVKNPHEDVAAFVGVVCSVMKYRRQCTEDV
jgi:hypothetical protein